jgi:hypothetical protein
MAPGAVRIHRAPERLRYTQRIETLDEGTQPPLAAFQKASRECQSRRDGDNGGKWPRAIGVVQYNRLAVPVLGTFGHEREKLRGHAGHVRRDEDGVVAMDVVEAHPRPGQRPFVRDFVAHEPRAIRALR